MNFHESPESNDQNAPETSKDTPEALSPLKDSSTEPAYVFTPSSKGGSNRIASLPDLPLGLSLVEFINRHLVGRDRTLSNKQTAACTALEAFLRNPNRRCFLLKGYAGTGKTFLIDWLNRYIQYINLGAPSLAVPTGRAAFVLAQITGARTSTIHGLIYQLTNLVIVPSKKSASGTPRFMYPLKDTILDNASQVFIVDESSMVSNDKASNEFHKFGSERVLKDLIEYARLDVIDAQSKMIFVGDPCQLPPVNSAQSHALDKEYLEKTFGFEVDEFEIDEVMRQAAASGILSTATYIREVVKSGKPDYFDIDYSKGDIDHVSRLKALPTDPPDVADLIASAFQRDEFNGIAVAATNEEVHNLNLAVRERLWGAAETDIRPGDRLVIGANSPNHQITNGELVMVVEVHPRMSKTVTTRNGDILKFREITIGKFYGPVTDRIKTCLILENYLWDPKREIAPGAKDALFWDFCERYYAKNPNLNPEENPKPATFRAALKADPFYNAVKTKFGYSLTCHKAQGGQWENVSVVFDLNRSDVYSLSHLRWAYTAITRAQSHLNVVNPPRLTPLSKLTGLAAPLPAAPLPNALTTPVPFQTYLETIIRQSLEPLKIAITGYKPIQGGEKYFFGRDGKDAVLVFWYDGDGYFTEIEDKAPEAKAWDAKLVEDIQRAVRKNAL
jgi:hypothetical protein